MSEHVAGEHGLLVLLLRQSFDLRNADDKSFAAQMRADVRHCLRCLRHNRNLEG